MSRSIFQTPTAYRPAVKAKERNFTTETTARRSRTQSGDVTPSTKYSSYASTPSLLSPQPQEQQLQQNLFLEEIRKEMDKQRLNLKDAVDQLVASGSSSPSGSRQLGPGGFSVRSRHASSAGSDYSSTSSLYGGEPTTAEPSTFVYKPNGNTGTAVFCALIDISAYPDDDVSVTYDDVADQIVVCAQRLDGDVDGRVTTFTQRVKMPRFADHARMRCRKRGDNLLAVEVPLLFFFPEDFAAEKHKPKSFVNGVQTQRDGRQSLEILVNPGLQFTSDDLQIKVDREAHKLIVFAVRSGDTGRGSFQTTIIKQYGLSVLADVDRISTRQCKDGRLAIHIPIRRKMPCSSSSTPTIISGDKKNTPLPAANRIKW